MSRKSGIWIDLQRALIYHLLPSGDTDWLEVQSNVDDSRPVGGSGSSTPFGSQDAVSEQKFLERRKHQLQGFFQRVSEHLSGSNELVIFGPAETKDKLSQFLNGVANRSYHLHPTQALDSITENQIKAAIRDFYGK